VVRTLGSSIRRALSRELTSAAVRSQALIMTFGSSINALPGELSSAAVKSRAMVSTRGSSIRRALPNETSSAVVLALLIGLIGSVSWRDGLAGDDYVDATVAAPPPVAAMQVSAEQPSFGRTIPDLQGLAANAAAGAGWITRDALIPKSPPVKLLIPSLRVQRPVEAVGTNRYGYMDLPVNGWNAGWYKHGPVPGAPGDAVIEGHAGYPDQPMLFGRLGNLKPGDRIVVVLADGSQRLFLVDSAAILPVGVAPAGLGQGDGRPRLTLVTCAGTFDKDTFSYSKRLVVEASYAGLA